LFCYGLFLYVSARAILANIRITTRRGIVKWQNLQETEIAEDGGSSLTMVLAPGVGFEPTWPKGPQAFKQSFPGLSSTCVARGSAPYLASRMAALAML